MTAQRLRKSQARRGERPLGRITPGRSYDLKATATVPSCAIDAGGAGHIGSHPHQPGTLGPQCHLPARAEALPGLIAERPGGSLLALNERPSERASPPHTAQLELGQAHETPAGHMTQCWGENYYGQLGTGDDISRGASGAADGHRLVASTRSRWHVSVTDGDGAIVLAQACGSAWRWRPLPCGLVGVRGP